MLWLICNTLPLAALWTRNFLRGMALWQDFGHWSAMQWGIAIAVVLALGVAIFRLLRPG